MRRLDINFLHQVQTQVNILFRSQLPYSVATDRAKTGQVFIDVAETDCCSLETIFICASFYTIIYIIQCLFYEM